jgi:Predicted nucleic-acid-binding protein containing a Zn-ribbon
MSKYINKEAKEFYEAAEKSELLIQKCEDCGEYVFFPRKYCPKDMGKLTFVKASGKGRILTYSIVVNDGQPFFKDLVPYVAAIVELEEGPTMYTRVVVDDPKEVTFGQKVEVVFQEQEGKNIPLFRPITDNVY